MTARAGRWRAESGALDEKGRRAELWKGGGGLGRRVDAEEGERKEGDEEGEVGLARVEMEGLPFAAALGSRRTDHSLLFLLLSRFLQYDRLQRERFHTSQA